MDLKQNEEFEIFKQQQRNEYRRLSTATESYFECQLPIVAETDKAICFDKDNGHLNKAKPVWIPKSQMKVLNMGENVGQNDYRYFIKVWLYKELK